ncbi:hypothetical protein ACGRHY_29105 [Streptomyces sp. HK10]|uniref:hypothetical protein n=1 Tax=Streptomyces sp. HK10 TaxID=3373255 RepID=UPI0037478A08
MGQAAGLPIFRVHVRYARARVGRWTYDGKVTQTEGQPSTFSYTDRRNRKRTTTRFTPLD